MKIFSVSSKRWVLPSSAQFPASARAQESNKPKNIVVKLASRVLRYKVLSFYRLSINVTSDLIGMSGTPCKVYINEHLTLFNKNLFRASREMAKKLS